MEINQPPKWAQPMFGGKRVCSICSSKKVYYERPSSWEESYDIGRGPIVNFTNVAMKCWCKDCFENCGGTHV